MKGHAVINDLEKAREILLDLENAIEKAGQICLGIRVLNPDFEQASEKEWKK